MRPFGTVHPLLGTISPSKPRRKVVEVRREDEKFYWRTVRIEE